MILGWYNTLVVDLYEQYFSSKDELVMEAEKNSSDATTTTRHGSD